MVRRSTESWSTLDTVGQWTINEIGSRIHTVKKFDIDFATVLQFRIVGQFDGLKLLLVNRSLAGDEVSTQLSPH